MMWTKKRRMDVDDDASPNTCSDGDVCVAIETCKRDQLFSILDT